MLSHHFKNNEDSHLNLFLQQEEPILLHFANSFAFIQVSVHLYMSDWRDFIPGIMSCASALTDEMHAEIFYQYNSAGMNSLSPSGKVLRPS